MSDKKIDPKEMFRRFVSTPSPVKVKHPRKETEENTAIKQTVHENIQQSATFQEGESSDQQTAARKVTLEAKRIAEFDDILEKKTSQIQKAGEQVLKTAESVQASMKEVDEVTQEIRKQADMIKVSNHLAVRLARIKEQTSRISATTAELQETLKKF